MRDHQNAAAFELLEGGPGGPLGNTQKHGKLAMAAHHFVDPRGHAIDEVANQRKTPRPQARHCQKLETAFVDEHLKGRGQRHEPPRNKNEKALKMVKKVNTSLKRLPVASEDTAEGETTMLHRFLTIGGVPELRSESASTDSDVVPEVELLLPVETYWAAQELIREMRYLRHSGQSILRHTQRLHKLVTPYVTGERERQMLLGTKAAPIAS